jgi:hypothetical protein
MLALYLVSIVIAWFAEPRGDVNVDAGQRQLRLVFAATMLEQARRSSVRCWNGRIVGKQV